MSTDFTIGLVGNPNCGKTTLFNELTGARQRVGNWPGVTVEKKSGEFRHADHVFNLVDLPGTYSLHVSHDDSSIDEQIAQNYILSGEADLILNIIDASSLERNLYLTTQIIDASIPMVVALNMMDVADKKGTHIDPYALSEVLGCPVVPIVASKGEGTGTLLDVIENVLDKPRCQVRPFQFPEPVRTAIDTVADIARQHADKQINHQLLATAILERDPRAHDHFPEHLHASLDEVVYDTESNINSSLEDFMVTARYQWIHQAVSHSATFNKNLKQTVSDRLDDILLNRWLAFPIFLGVMYLMFMFTINIGSAFIDAFDGVAGAIFVDGFAHVLSGIGSPDWLTALLANGVGGGIQLVASFIPVIACLFFFLSFLEDSGYMARAAFIIDRIMCSVGLPGKSFVPLIVGFGCNVPSVMATRTLENQSDRLMTTIMAPFMSCGARLTVYALFAAAFFPQNGQNVVFGLYLIGILLAVVSGFIIRKFMMPSDLSPFIMELPQYHLPTLKGMLIRTWQRLKGFILRAGKAIVAVVIILNFVNSIGTDGSFGNEDTENSALSAIGKSITPLFEPMGMAEENWPAAVGIFTGIFAKEVVVGTLDTLYTQMGRSLQGITEEEPEFNLGESLSEAIATIPANLMDALSSADDPLGINIGDVSDAMTAAEEQEVELNTITLMSQLFDGKAGAFAYLLFILLYIPCVATIGAIYKELGGFWAVFTAVWTYVTAYAVAVGFYQIATFSQHPASSAAWIAGMTAMMAICYTVLIVKGRKQTRKGNLIPVVNL
ncbi:MAG: Fe(2+) transporter permease subunit FeoB [Enterobacterales bacterium]|nr:Fe(2+) transporter permease subunit FeoB [Enterobacterales bacterium]